MSARIAFLVSLLLVGCGGSSTATRPAATASSARSTSDDGTRAVTGQGCHAAYLAEHDATLLTVEIPGGGVAAAPAVGDGWEIACRRQGNELVFASRGNENVSVVIDGLRELPADLTRYANEHAEATRESLRSHGVEGVRVADPLLTSDSVYAIVMNGTMQGRAFAQVSVYSLVLSPLGVLRYHASVTASNVETAAGRSYEYIPAAQRFAYLTPEQVAAIGRGEVP